MMLAPREPEGLLYAYVTPTISLEETNGTVSRRKEGVITTHADVFGWVEVRATLPYQDISGDYGHTVMTFYAKSFTNCVATVPTGALSFLMSHDLLLNPW
tara:strand:+ start:1660 stop:1959 length:300 start_codon:yes stop_codon:yes gene_type:complete